jgi:F0F1-type ATP synthase epsilon subunit
MKKIEDKPGKLIVKIRSKTGQLYSGDAFSVTSRNESGVFDILPYHVNFISLIFDFVIVDKDTPNEKKFDIEKGILYMIENNINIYVGL